MSSAGLLGSFSCVKYTADLFLYTVHAEPGQDKITFANDVADWILARTDEAAGPKFENAIAKSRL